MSVFLALLLAAQSPSEPVDLNAIVAELEAKSDWTEADRERAEAVAKLRFNDWGVCLRSAQSRLHRSTETVETVATAIIGSCLGEEQAYRRAFTISYRGMLTPMDRTEVAEKAISTARASVRETIISQLVTERLLPQQHR